MSEEKYYTPELREFNVALEYQYLPEDGTEWIDYSFGDDKPFVFDSEGWRSWLLDLIEKNRIRVKYLGKEDIKDCGWNGAAIKMYSASEDEFSSGYMFGLFFMTLHSDNEVIIYKSSTMHNSLNVCIANIVFDGIIKNKSELRFIMDRLGIK